MNFKNIKSAKSLHTPIQNAKQLPNRQIFNAKLPETAKSPPKKDDSDDDIILISSSPSKKPAYSQIPASIKSPINSQYRSPTVIC